MCVGVGVGVPVAKKYKIFCGWEQCCCVWTSSVETLMLCNATSHHRECQQDTVVGEGLLKRLSKLSRVLILKKKKTVVQAYIQV